MSSVCMEGSVRRFLRLDSPRLTSIRFFPEATSSSLAESLEWDGGFRSVRKLGPAPVQEIPRRCSEAFDCRGLSLGLRARFGAMHDRRAMAEKRLDSATQM
jgi:hypothetical protein